MTPEQLHAEACNVRAAFTHAVDYDDEINILIAALKRAELASASRPAEQRDGWTLTKAWDEGFAAGVGAMRGGPRAFPPENPYRAHSLHADCLCPQCRTERIKRIGAEAAEVEHERIREKARAVFGDTGLPATTSSDGRRVMADRKAAVIQSCKCGKGPYDRSGRCCRCLLSVRGEERRRRCSVELLGPRHKSRDIRRKGPNR